MTKGEFRKVKFFTEFEPWGDLDLIDTGLVMEMDKARGLLGRPMYVTSGTQGEHAANSQHYKGKAVDFVINAEGVDIIDTMFLLLRLKFDAIGVYPDWHYAGIKRVIGFHVEFNETRKQKGLWIGTKSEEGIKYSGLTSRNLKQAGLLT